MSKVDWRYAYFGHRDVPHQPERRGRRFESILGKRLVFNGTWTRQRARQAARQDAKNRRNLHSMARMGRRL